MSDIEFLTSGAIILSDLDRLHELLWPGIDGVEIGSLPDLDGLSFVQETLRDLDLGLGLHAPVLSSGVKLGLCGPKGMADDVRQQLLMEKQVSEDAGAQYLLLHHPWLPHSELSRQEAKEQVCAQMADLLALGSTSVPLVFELKLGVDRNPGVLGYVIREGGSFLPLSHGLCLDVGDWILACRALQADPVQSLHSLAPLVQVMHVHSIRMLGARHIWQPLHPDHEDASIVVELCRIVKAVQPDVRIVFEYTPQFDRGSEYAQAGLRWLRRQLLTGT